jgi:hypothetical protein
MTLVRRFPRRWLSRWSPALVMVTWVTAAGPRGARACGGGLVTTTLAQIGADVQRIVLSVHDGSTDVITQIGVPATSADYGVIIPVPSRPTLDPEPVMARELEGLDNATGPRIRHASGGGGGVGCACGGTAGARAGASPAEVGAPVNIGPVTAVPLTADTGEAIADWLTANGFALPAEHRALIAAYAAPGRYFIALRRNDSAASSGATSVGIHFTLPGDERTMPLRFARLGAARQVAFTIFVAADNAVGPTSPFQTLSLNDLDARTLEDGGYRAAVEKAVSLRNGKAFVHEGVSEVRPMRATGTLGAQLGRVLVDGQKISRLTTVVAAEALTEDTTFIMPVSYFPRDRTLSAARAPGGGPFALAVALAFVRTGRRRRATGP